MGPELLFIGIFAILAAALLTGAFRWRHPASEGFWPSAIFLGLLLFLALWAASQWTVLTPTLFGITFWPLLIIGLVVVFTIGMLTPPRRRPGEPRERTVAEETPPPEDREDAPVAAGVVFGILFWVFVVAMIAIGVIGLIGVTGE